MQVANWGCIQELYIYQYQTRTTAQNNNVNFLKVENLVINTN